MSATVCRGLINRRVCPVQNTSNHWADCPPRKYGAGYADRLASFQYAHALKVLLGKQY